MFTVILNGPIRLMYNDRDGRYENKQKIIVEHEKQ